MWRKLLAISKANLIQSAQSPPADRKLYLIMRAVSFVRFIALSVWAAVCAIAPASAQDAPATMIVVDGSGSMWGRIDADKRAKIDIVREALGPILARSTTARIGLTSYGHRRRGDCSDVEIISAPTIEHALVIGAVEKLNPRGKGPIAEALVQTAKAIGAARPASILVITDGSDNCQQDACEAANGLAKTAPGVAVHLISLAVEPDEVAQLSCVAKVTGGKYFDVRDAQSIAPAIEEATKLAMLAPNTPALASGPANKDAAPAPPAAATATPSLRLSAALADRGPALSTAIHWRIAKTGGALIREGDAPDLVLTLEAGSYDVDADLGLAHTRQTVTFDGARSASVVVPLNAGRLKIKARAAREGDAALPLISIGTVASEKDGATNILYLSRAAQSEVIIPQGTYQVSATEGLAKQQRQLSVAAGADADIDLALGIGRLQLSASVRENGEPIDDVTFTVAEDDPDSPDGRREIARSNAPKADFSLPPGTYYVSARAGESETRQRIAIGQGDAVERVLVLPIGRLKVSSVIGGQPATDSMGLVYRVTSLDGEPHEVARSALPALDLSLKAGRYRVSVNLDTRNVKAAQEVTLEAGKPLDITLKLDAAEAALKLPQGTIASAGDVFWEIRDSAGQPVWHTTAAEPHAVLAPGRYTVRLETRDRHTEAAFELRSGERRAIQLGAN